MKNCRMLFIVMGLTLFFIIASSTGFYAQTINARFTTSVYSWQQKEIDSNSANHVRAYQLAQVTIGNIGLPGLSFHTYLNLSNDFGEEAVDDPRVWIYNCYFNYKNTAKAIDLSLGRQRVYAGVGYGTIDGMQVKYGFRDFFKCF